MGCIFSSSDVKDNNLHPISPTITDPPLATDMNDTHKSQSLIPSERVWSSEYYSARSKAAEYSTKRSKCFEESQKAFSEGRKQEAKDLSNEGKKYGEIVEESNKRAVAEVLKTQDWKNSGTLDLHGLHVSEAVDITKEFVRINIGVRKTAIIITGQGIHSDKSKGPVIKPAIIELCKKEKWRLEAHPNNSGSFTLDIPIK